MFNLCRINTSCKFYTFFSSFYLFLSPPPSFSLSLFLSLFRPTPQPLPCIFICFYCSSIPMLMTFLTHNFFVLVQGAHRKALDVLNTVGLSNSVLKLIERRNRVDKWIKYTGMVVSVVVLYTFWRWAHWFLPILISPISSSNFLGGLLGTTQTFITTCICIFWDKTPYFYFFLVYISIVECSVKSLIFVFFNFRKWFSSNLKVFYFILFYFILF